MNDQQTKMMGHHPTLMSQQPPPQVMNPVLMNTVQPQLLNQMVSTNQPPQAGISGNQPPMFVAQRNYAPWGPQQQLQNPNAKKFNNKKISGNWKGKKMQNPNIPFSAHSNSINKPSASVPQAGGSGYHPPSLNDLQTQNRMKARKFYYPKKKFNDNVNNNSSNSARNHRSNRFAPYAPRNTSSFIIRAKKAGGIAELVSPCPVTPAVLPTPMFSPSRELLGDMAKEEWGVDGYGSMKGLIRLRSPPGGGDGGEDDEEGNGSSESDVEEHVEVERRLDHDLSRFEMIYPAGDYSYSGYSNLLENRVDDQDSHIAQLEEENITLKERLFLMESELGDLRRRLQFLERQQLGNCRVGQNEEVVDNVSENDENESDGGSDVRGGSNGCENDVDDTGVFERVLIDSSKTTMDTNDMCMDDVLRNDADTKRPNKSTDNGEPLADQAVLCGPGANEDENMREDDTSDEFLHSEAHSQETNATRDCQSYLENKSVTRDN